MTVTAPSDQILLDPAQAAAAFPGFALRSADAAVRKSPMTTGLFSAVFGLSERPFTLLPDPDFLFWSEMHQWAFTMMEYGIIAGGPITLLTGNVGTGKTTLMHRLLQTLDSRVTVGLISNAQGGRGDLFRWALHAFGLPHDPKQGNVDLFAQLRDFFLSESRNGRAVMIVIDEAQNLSTDALEALRMLLNLNTGKSELVQLLLIGQPELRTLIERPDMRQFSQRVFASFHLAPLDAKGTADYIAHRLRHAGGSGKELCGKAATLVHEASGGIPRTINKICDLAMIYTAAEGSNRVRAATVADVLADNPPLLPLETAGVH